MNETRSQEILYDAAYKLIKSKAGTNSFVQGISGIAGFPTTLAIDGIVIFTHYEPMIQEIRELYGYPPLEKNSILHLMSSISKELLFDIVVDKLMGQIPVAGVYFNAICAKALTWRLGILFTIISSRGEEINYDSLSDVVKLIRKITPQSDIFRFATPDYETFKKIALSIHGNDFHGYDEKIRKAVSAFD